MKLLVIDDDGGLRRTLKLTLEAMGHGVAEASDAAKALELAGRVRYDFAFLDVRLGRDDGIDLLPKLLALSPGLPVCVMTAYAAIDTAVEAMRRGAADYLPKPFTPQQLREVLGRARPKDSPAEAGTDLSSDEPAVLAALDLAFRAADTDAAILIRGESGTGKGVLARAIHGKSRRSGGPFVTVNCPGLSGELLENELFGHARGAYTGATEASDGKVAAAEKGTMFLDEIGDLPVTLQPKLLRFAQDKEYERVGEAKTRTGDVRLVAATNRDLEADVRAGRFREDLLYRLNVIEVTLPPLRQRPRDLMPIAGRLLGQFAAKMGRAARGFTEAAASALGRHPWPGNLRELRNAVERGVILATGPEVGVEHLPPAVCSPAAQAGRRPEAGGDLTLEELEAEHLRRVLASHPSLEDAARALGIDPSTLYRKRKKLGL